MKKQHKILKRIVFAVAVIGVTYLVNVVIEVLATRGHKLASSPEDFYKWKNGKVYYQKKGKGKPLLLLHDLTPESSAFEWHKVIDGLAQTHTVYALDLPGCGRSDKEQMTYTGFFYVQLIQDFLREIVGTKADIAATAASAPLAVSAASYDSTNIDRVVLVNPVSCSSMHGDRGPLASAAAKLLEIPVLGTLVYHLTVTRNQIDLHFTEEILYNPFHADSETIDAYYEAAHLGNAGGKYLESSLRKGSVDVSLSHALQKCDNGLCIIGGQSFTNIGSILKEYSSLHPGTTSTLIRNTKKLPQIEEPQLFIQEINAFLD